MPQLIGIQHIDLLVKEGEGLHVEFKERFTTRIDEDIVALPETLDTRSFGRVSIRRNELIADLFHRMDKGERAGTGIRRMNEAMKAAGQPQPEFSFGTFCTITFKRPDFSTEVGLIPESKSLADPVTGEVTGEVYRLLNILVTSSLTRTEIQSALELNSQANFRDRYLEPALKKVLIEMSLPNKPTSRLQKFRLTEKGRAVLANLHGSKAS